MALDDLKKNSQMLFNSILTVTWGTEQSRNDQMCLQLQSAPLFLLVNWGSQQLGDVPMAMQM